MALSQFWIGILTFPHLQKLRSLDVSRKELPHFHVVLHNTKQLRGLDVSRKELPHFHVVLHNTKKLRVLNLRDNKLTTLSAKIRTELDEMVKVQVDISGNPLHCLSNNIDFVSWIKNSKVKFLNKYFTFCIEKDNSRKRLFHFSDSEQLMHACQR